jgi:molybdopterin biosynthesis enzyme
MLETLELLKLGAEPCVMFPGFPLASRLLLMLVHLPLLSQLCVLTLDAL